MMRTRKISAVLTAALMCSMLVPANSTVTAADTLMSADAIETMEGVTIKSEQISTENNKNIKYNNPVSPDFYCADPTAVEYNGRLYLIGTNDHEQFLKKGADLDNTYEQIKSFVILSTDDMVNWVYHGEINVGEIAPWIVNSWAPTITSRVEEDGKTHFYLYFSNNGLGVGVITATDPLGPWSDPLGKPLISTSTPGLTDCPNPFDPGVVIDDNGVGWLSFGAGMASNGTDYMPGSVRIVQLGDDMLSFASDFAVIPAPYNFEASELNYINDTYVYTYNTDWSDHSEKWDYDVPVPGGCSMVYMTTKTPLDPDSWEMRGDYFKNPGEAGFDYSNNHTHLHKFKDNYYIFYHTLMLKNGMGIKGSYRSLGVDEIEVDESTLTFTRTGGTKNGTSSIAPVDPFSVNNAAELNNTAQMQYDTTDMAAPKMSSITAGSWLSVRGVEFTKSDAPDQPADEVTEKLTNIEKIDYEITVSAVDAPTTISMYPASKDGDCPGSVDVTGTGNYTISCEIGSDKMINMGYFRASDDTLVTFTLDSIVINDKYEFDISTELTNTREWADGLKNIWNGFSDGDNVYEGDNANLRYSKADDAIELMVQEGGASGGSDAPLVEQPMTFCGKVKGAGRVEVRLDAPTGELLTSIDFDSADKYATVYNSKVAAVGGTHDLYFVFSDKDITLDSWCFATSDPTEWIMGDVNADGTFDMLDVVTLQKWLLADQATDIKNWRAGDFCEDKILDVFDLGLMKRELLGK